MKNPVVLSSAVTHRGETTKVMVEVGVSAGIGIHLVGLADAAVKETLLRVITALQSCGYHIPGKKIVINLSPDDRRNSRLSSGWFDLPVALGILLASGQIEANVGELEQTIFVGELGLDGKLRAPASGFVHDTDAALVISWKYRDDFSVWGWDTDCKGGSNWLDVKDLNDAIELLMNTMEK